MATTPKTRFTVEVTERDIERAHKNDSYNCVVAQAVARTVQDATRIEVDTQSIRFTVGDERRIYMTPYAVQGYVIAFDAGEPIEPFSFQLRNPRRVARRVRTDAGRAVSRATETARRATSKQAAAKVTTPKEKAVVTAAEPSGDPEKDAAAAARAAYAEASAEHAGAKLSVKKGPQAPPRVFKKKARAYGHRLLRINKEVERS
jgi:hypothetical protein